MQKCNSNIWSIRGADVLTTAIMVDTRGMRGRRCPYVQSSHRSGQQEQDLLFRPCSVRYSLWPASCASPAEHRCCRGVASGLQVVVPSEGERTCVDALSTVSSTSHPRLDASSPASSRCLPRATTFIRTTCIRFPAADFQPHELHPLFPPRVKL
jgi:hypothetical protein